MYAANTSHTVAFENPLSAHAVACAGAGRTSPSVAAMHTPSRPIAAPGIGSAMTPVIVARKSAKKCHAFALRPSGVGTSSTAPPTTNGASALKIIDWRVRDAVAGAAISAVTGRAFISGPRVPLRTSARYYSDTICCMKGLTFAAAFAGVVLVAAAAEAQTPLAHRFTQVAPGVYSAVGNGTIETRSSNMVIVNGDDVFLVDTNITPEATRRLINDIKTLTDKPVRYVVNTHWHYDHTDGNQVFGPDVALIGHANERSEILAGVLKNRIALEFQNLPEQLDNLRKQIASETDPAKKKQ